MFEAIQKALAIGTLAEDEYMQGDIVMCSKCLTPRSSIIRGMNLRHACKCRRAEYDRVRQESKDREKQAKIKQLRIDSLMGERYKDFRFSTVETGHNPNFDAALARCRSYAEKHEVVLKKGWGIYLHGPKGTGKTTLTACMANDLLSKVKQVSFTNFFEISKAIRATYGGAGNEGDLIERIGTIDFLFLDDLGTERLKKDGEDTWMQERIFEIVNKRYNHRKPTVFTSNYGLNQLVSRGMMDKTVDRISEMSTAIIKIDGESYRGKLQPELLPF